MEATHPNRSVEPSSEVATRCMCVCVCVCSSSNSSSRSSSSSRGNSLRADVAPFRPTGISVTESNQMGGTKEPSISPTSKSMVERKKHQKQTQSNTGNSLENRKKCGCQSTVHPFLSSCYLCGRIICEVEGPFNCYNCNAAFVPTINGDEAEAAGYGQDTVDAYRQKDKLMIYDKEHAKRTKVYDAQADYYESSAWLTEEEKEELKKRDQKRREKYRPTKRRTKLTLDFAERRVLEASSSSEDNEDEDDDDNFYAHESAGDSSSGRNGVKFIDPPNGPFDKTVHYSEGKHSRNGATEKCVSSGEDEDVDIENLRLLEENSKAGNVYRSLMSRLAPWREEH